MYTREIIKFLYIVSTRLWNNVFGHVSSFRITVYVTFPFRRCVVSVRKRNEEIKSVNERELREGNKAADAKRLKFSWVRDGCVVQFPRRTFCTPSVVRNMATIG